MINGSHRASWGGRLGASTLEAGLELGWMGSELFEGDGVMWLCRVMMGG